MFLHKVFKGKKILLQNKPLHVKTWWASFRPVPLCRKHTDYFYFPSTKLKLSCSLVNKNIQVTLGWADCTFCPHITMKIFYGAWELFLFSFLVEVMLTYCCRYCERTPFSKDLWPWFSHTGRPLQRLWEPAMVRGQCWWVMHGPPTFGFTQNSEYFSSGHSVSFHFSKGVCGSIHK